MIRDPRTILPAAAARHYRQESRKLSLLISEVLRQGAGAGWIRSDLNFQLVAESILGMIRGLPRHRREEVTLEAAVTTIVGILLDGCRAGRRQTTRDFHPTNLNGEPSARARLKLTARRAPRMHNTQT